MNLNSNVSFTILYFFFLNLNKLFQRNGVFVSIVCTYNMVNARPLAVALYSTAIAGHCFIYVVICCCFVLSFLLLFVAFDVLIVYCTFLGNMRDL